MSTVARPTHGRRVIVAVNPTSAFGKNSFAGLSTAHALIEAGHDVVELRRESFAELRDAARDAIAEATQAKAAHPVLVVVGGDGMVSLGVNLVAGTPVDRKSVV